MNSFRDLQKQIADIDDPEIRARQRREFGLVGLDEDGRVGPLGDVDGGGIEAGINASVVGRDWVEFYDGDEAMIAAEEKARAEMAHAARYLTRADVTEIFDAVSFAVQETGVLFNAQLTIVYRGLGIDGDGQAAAKLLSDFLRECRMRLTAWGYRFDAVYVHENSENRGLHTHLITALPVHLRGRLQDWTMKFFARHNPAAPSLAEAVKLQVSGVRSLGGRLDLHRHRLTYLCKGLDPDILDRDEDGKLKPLLELIGVPEKFRRPAGVIPCSQRCGASHSIAVSARGQTPVPLSMIRMKRWSSLHSGWEVEEFPRRRQAKELAEVLRNLTI